MLQRTQLILGIARIRVKRRRRPPKSFKHLHLRWYPGNADV